jgi:hypothetical protein
MWIMQKQRHSRDQYACFFIRIFAELVFAHLFSGVRFLHDSNRNMPLEGDTNFEGLKKPMQMESS